MGSFSIYSGTDIGIYLEVITCVVGEVGGEVGRSLELKVVDYRKRKTSRRVSLAPVSEAKTTDQRKVVLRNIII